MTADIIDRIDALVDSQLRQERSGYDHNLNQQRCPHCGRDFHGLAITERLEQLRRQRCADRECVECVTALAEYRYVDDESRVLCPGSRFIGPILPPVIDTGFQVGTIGFEPVFAAEPVYGRGYAQVGLFQQQPTQPWVIPDDPFDPACWVNPFYAAEIQFPRISPLERTRDLLAEAQSFIADLNLAPPPEPEPDPRARALPRPSITPPMWAPDMRRRRHRR